MAFGALWRGRAQPQTASSASMSRSSSGRGDLIHCLSPLQQPLQVTPSVTAAVASNLCPRINRHRQAPRSSTNSVGHSGAGGNHHHRTPWWKSWTKKYVILCCLCGGTAVLLGVVFLIIYFVLNHYTTSLQYFETIPTYAPALVLIVTGLLVTCFARRRNRYAYLIKVAGGCCLMCALLCVVITVTTTVIHMNRLQTLRECVYTKKSKTCTCFAGIGDDEGAARYVFNDTPDCEVVHGGLYTCLRAMFGLSVVGILVCIFSSMLVYQLLSHEKKKMYWEQLEMRRRFFYRQSTHPLYCNCYDDYGFAAPSTPHDLYHWQSWEVNSDRCWPSRSFAPRLGFGVTHEDSGGGSGSQRSILIGSTGHRASGWNWLPWSRSRPSQVSCSGNNNQSGGGGSGGDSSVIAGVADSDQAATPALADDQSSMHHLHHHHQVFPTAATANHLHHLHHHQYHHPTTYWGVDQSVANNTVNRHSSNSGGGSRRGHRRRRSNDAIFHHLNMTPPFVTDASYAPSYATYGNMPPPPPPHHHLWGPPPPYSRPPSAENMTATSLSSNGNGINITPRGRFINGVALPTVGGTGVQQSPIMMLQTSADDLSTNVLVRGRSRPSNDRQEDKPPSLPSNDIFVDIGSSFSSEYEQSRANKRMHHHGPDWSGTVPLSARQQRTTDSESNCSKSTPHIPRICIWPSESCLLEIVSDAVIRKEGRRGLSVTCEANDGDSEEASVLTEAEQSSSSESFEVEVDDDDEDDEDDEDDDDDDDLGSNFRTSMMVSTAPSTPIIDENPSCFSVDMTVAHSLPNLNLSLGPLNSAANNYSSEDNCKRVTRGDQTHESDEDGKITELVMMTTSQQQQQSPLITDVHVPPPKLDNRQPVPPPPSSAAVEPPSTKARIQCPLGMSDSSPALPPFFRTDNNQDDAAAAHRYLSSIENLFQRHCAANYLDTNTTSGGGIKSKSLGNLSPNDNIIVTFKSIHV